MARVNGGLYSPASLKIFVLLILLNLPFYRSNCYTNRSGCLCGVIHSNFYYTTPKILEQHCDILLDDNENEEYAENLKSFFP
jgi:hypothetical protein